MPGLEAARLLSWASPDEQEFVGHAYSEEHLAELTRDVTAERRAFLHHALTAEVLRREGVTTAMDDLLADKAELSFSDIPLTSTLTKEQHMEFASARSTYFSPKEASVFWTHQVQWFATMSGFRPWATKNDDFFFGGDLKYRYQHPILLQKAEKNFDEACQQSAALVGAGYRIRFLMDGAVYVYNAALDVSSLEADIELFNNDPNSVMLFAAPVLHWDEILKMKRLHDKANKLKTFADVAKRLNDGLYVAPYYPAELKASGDYICFDDVRSAALGVGNKSQSAATRTFRQLVRLACEDEALEEEINQLYFDPTPPQQRSGVLFLSTAVLPNLYDLLASQRSNKSSSAVMLDIAGELLEAHGPDKDFTDLVYAYKN